MVSTMPAVAKYIPFLKIGIFGVYIQNAESTKNNNDNPKKIFKKYKGLSVVALCKRSIFSSIKGSFIFFTDAIPVF